MIDGRTLYQISKGPPTRPGGPRVGLHEWEHKRCKFKQYLPAQVFPDGTVRARDLIQFWTDPGGLRTVAAEDIVDISKTRTKASD